MAEDRQLNEPNEAEVKAEGSEEIELHGDPGVPDEADAVAAVEQQQEEKHEEKHEKKRSTSKVTLHWLEAEGNVEQKRRPELKIRHSRRRLTVTNETEELIYVAVYFQLNPRREHRQMFRFAGPCELEPGERKEEMERPSKLRNPLVAVVSLVFSFDPTALLETLPTNMLPTTPHRHIKIDTHFHLHLYRGLLDASTPLEYRTAPTRNVLRAVGVEASAVGHTVVATALNPLAANARLKNRKLDIPTDIRVTRPDYMSTTNLAAAHLEAIGQKQTQDPTPTSPLCEAELESLAARKEVSRKALEKYLDMDLTDKKLPIVSVACSGGGHRSLVYALRAFEGWRDVGLLDCIHYMSSLSGSCWALGYWLKFGSNDFAGIMEKLVECMERSPADHYCRQTRHIAQLMTGYRRMVRMPRCRLMDLYCVCLNMQLFDDLKPTPFSYRLSKLQEECRFAEGAFPIPIFSSIYQEAHGYEWFECTPFEVGSEFQGAFVHPDSFGSVFKEGELDRRGEVMTLGRVMAFTTSAICLSFKHLLRQVFATEMAFISEGARPTDDQPMLGQAHHMLAGDASFVWSMEKIRGGQSHVSHSPDYSNLLAKELAHTYGVPGDSSTEEEAGPDVGETRRASGGEHEELDVSDVESGDEDSEEEEGVGDALDDESHATLEKKAASTLSAEDLQDIDADQHELHCLMDHSGTHLHSKPDARDAKEEPKLLVEKEQKVEVTEGTAEGSEGEDSSAKSGGCSPAVLRAKVQFMHPSRSLDHTSESASRGAVGEDEQPTGKVAALKQSVARHINDYLERHQELANKFIIGPTVVPNFTYRYTGKAKRTKWLRLIDAGFDFCMPFPPLMRSDRMPGILIVLEMSAHPNCEDGSSLKGALDWAKDNNVRMPEVDMALCKAPFADGKQVRVFEDDDPEVPTIIYFTLQRNPAYGDFDPVQNMKDGGYCATFSSTSMTPQQIKELGDLAYTMVTMKEVNEEIKAAMRRKIAQLNP